MLKAVQVKYCNNKQIDHPADTRLYYRLYPSIK